MLEHSVPKKHTHILCLATAVLLILLFCSHYPAGIRTELDDHLSGGKQSVLSSGAQVSPEIVTNGEKSDAPHLGRLTGASDRHSESVRPLRLFMLICAVFSCASCCAAAGAGYQERLRSAVIDLPFTIFTISTEKKTDSNHFRKTCVTDGTF